MLPADERLEEHDPRGLQVHDRLVVDHELALPEAPGQVRAQLAPGDDRRMHHRLEDRDAVLARRLGAVHRDIGVTQEVARALGVPATGRDPDARPDRRLLARHREGHPQRIDDPVGDAGGMAEVRLILDQDRELVPAEPRRQVVGPQDAAEPIGDVDQQPVAGRVPVRVVDHLEVVEIEEEDDRRPGRGLVREERVDAFDEQAPVRQPGERVVIGLVAELLLEPRKLGQRLLELAVLEGDRRLVGERLEQAQVVLGEGRPLGQPVGDEDGADELGLAAQRADHRVADARVVGPRRLVEERPGGRGDPRVQRVRDDPVDRPPSPPARRRATSSSGAPRVPLRG